MSRRTIDSPRDAAAWQLYQRATQLLAAAGELKAIAATLLLASAEQPGRGTAAASSAVPLSPPADAGSPPGFAGCTAAGPRPPAAVATTDEFVGAAQASSSEARVVGRSKKNGSPAASKRVLDLDAANHELRVAARKW